MHFLTIGNPAGRRVQYWANALNKNNHKHTMLSYDQILLGDLPKINIPTTVRITSPGEDPDLWHTLIKLGGCTKQLSILEGEIYPNPYWYKGWQLLLKKIDAFVANNPNSRFLNTSEGILLSFHKLKCQYYLQTKGISCPKIIVDKVIDYNGVVTILKEKKIQQVFIKPYHGSSASGVMALKVGGKNQVLYTSVLLKNGKLYNSLKMQQYRDKKQIERIINAMVPAGLMVEEWIPKKKYSGKSVDFRFLVINGEVTLSVPRMSNHYITNLHLGNEKGNSEEVINDWGAEIIEEASKLASKAVSEINGLFYAGVDVAISKNGKPYILEVNAFGDLLLGITNNGKNAYELELEQWTQHWV